jgi:DNA-binding response OmpR family regulator
MARIRANLPPEVMIIDECLLIDDGSRRGWVCRDGRWQEVRLQPLQYELLDLLILNAGQTLLTTMLKDRVWGKPVSDSILAVYIHRLRERVEPNPAIPIYIENVKGLGYRFNGRPTRASLAILEHGCNCAPVGGDR